MQPDISKATIHDASYDGVDMRGQRLGTREWKTSRFVDCSFRGAQIDDDLGRGTFQRCVFDDVQAAGSRAAMATIEDCSFVGADLGGSQFVETRMVDVDLDGANLRGATLDVSAISGTARAADLTGATITATHRRKRGLVCAVDFTGAKLDGAKFVGLDVTKSKFDDNCPAEFVDCVTE